jgi:3-methyladenine DNA glycosylase AlkC
MSASDKGMGTEGTLYRRQRATHCKADVTLERLDVLNRGVAQSRTHIEEMVMDWGILLDSTFPDHSLDIETVRRTPFIQRFRLVGTLLFEQYGDDVCRSDFCWISDTVRGWIAMSLASHREWTIAQKVSALSPFIRDHHFAVREWAWLAIRPDIVADPQEALCSLQRIARSRHPFDRRFAVEALRPRSVWGTHIPLFKRDPELVQGLLGQLRCDPHPYVRLSVGNWLNDVAGTRPDWVASVTQAWLKACSCEYTVAIVRRGCRRLFQSSRTVIPRP